MDLKRLLNKQREILMLQIEKEGLTINTVQTLRAAYDYSTAVACLAELQHIEKENRV